MKLRDMPASCKFQWLLWKIGIHWHNTFRNECTPNFSCCIGKYPVGSEERYILGAVADGVRNGKDVIPLTRFPATGSGTEETT
jgi:hypothetical protein